MPRAKRPADALEPSQAAKNIKPRRKKKATEGDPIPAPTEGPLPAERPEGAIETVEEAKKVALQGEQTEASAHKTLPEAPTAEVGSDTPAQVEEKAKQYEKDVELQETFPDKERQEVANPLKAFEETFANSMGEIEKSMMSKLDARLEQLLQSLPKVIQSEIVQPQIEKEIQTRKLTQYPIKDDQVYIGSNIEQVQGRQEMQHSNARTYVPEAKYHPVPYATPDYDTLAVRQRNASHLQMAQPEQDPRYTRTDNSIIWYG